MEVLPLPSPSLPLSSPGPPPQILVKRLSPGANFNVDSQRERKRQARMSSHCPVPTPEPPQGTEGSVPLLWNDRRLGTKSKGPGQCCVGKAENSSAGSSGEHSVLLG